MILIGPRHNLYIMGNCRRICWMGSVAKLIIKAKLIQSMNSAMLEQLLVPKHVSVFKDCIYVITVGGNRNNRKKWRKYTANESLPILVNIFVTTFGIFRRRLKIKYTTNTLAINPFSPPPHINIFKD